MQLVQGSTPHRQAERQVERHMRAPTSTIVPLVAAVVECAVQRRRRWRVLDAAVSVQMLVPRSAVIRAPASVGRSVDRQLEVHSERELDEKRGEE